MRSTTSIIYNVTGQTLAKRAVGDEARGHAARVAVDDGNNGAVKPLASGGVDADDDVDDTLDAAALLKANKVLPSLSDWVKARVAS